MGTRCGRIDPGILLYLLEHDKLSLEQLTDLLYRESGLLGFLDFRRICERSKPRTGRRRMMRFTISRTRSGSRSRV